MLLCKIGGVLISYLMGSRKLQFMHLNYDQISKWKLLLHISRFSKLYNWKLYFVYSSTRIKVLYFQQDDGEIYLLILCLIDDKDSKRTTLEMHFGTIQMKSFLAICLQLKYPSLKRLEFNSSRILKQIVLHRIFKLYLVAH